MSDYHNKIISWLEEAGASKIKFVKGTGKHGGIEFNWRGEPRMIPVALTRSQANGNAIAEREVVLEKPAEVPHTEEPQMSAKLYRDLTRLLDNAIQVRDRYVQYVGELNDKKVAQSLSVATDLVTRYREEAYGVLEPPMLIKCRELFKAIESEGQAIDNMIIAAKKKVESYG